MRNFLFLLFFGFNVGFPALLNAQASIAEPLPFKQALVEINGQQLKVELADTWELRARGLMHRTELCQQCGMLFQFEQERLISMWMKNTLIPLDVAYFKQDGEIIDIRQMQPLDLTSVPSSEPVYYALEMNQGWFAANGVKEGDYINVISTGPTASTKK